MLTVKRIEDALRKKGGNITVAAKALGISRRQLTRRIKDSATLAELIDELREERSDLAEDKLGQAIKNGESWAICFHLKTQAKSRGYSEKTETEHSGKVEHTVDVGKLKREVIREMLGFGDDGSV